MFTDFALLERELNFQQNPYNIFHLTITLVPHYTHNRFTAGLEYVRVHPGQQVPER